MSVFGILIAIFGGIYLLIKYTALSFQNAKSDYEAKTVYEAKRNDRDEWVRNAVDAQLEQRLRLSIGMAEPEAVAQLKELAKKYPDDWYFQTAAGIDREDKDPKVDRFVRGIALQVLMSQYGKVRSEDALMGIYMAGTYESPSSAECLKKQIRFLQDLETELRLHGLGATLQFLTANGIPHHAEYRTTEHGKFTFCAKAMHNYKG